MLSVGYKTVMLNQTVDESTIENDKKKKKKGEESKTMPDPINVCKLNEKFQGKLCILNRITFICSSPTKTHTLV